jgi:hypothetical protein
MIKLSFALAFAAGALLRAAEPTPLDVKAGEWEYSVTMKMAGMPQMGQMPQIPADKLAQMPPEQRARVEALMKNAGNMASGKPMVNKHCLKKEDMANFNPTGMSKTCKMTVVSSSGRKFEAKVACDEPDNKTTSTIVAEAQSAESMTFTVTSTGTSHGKPVNMNINGSGKWLGAACSDK